MEKRNRIIYWVTTGLVCVVMLMSASMYFFNNREVSKLFIKFGYPTYIIYPLAVAKVLAVVALVSNKSKVLKEWAYAGIFFDVILATSAHLSVNDGGHYLPLGVMVLLLISRVSIAKYMLKFE